MRSPVRTMGAAELMTQGGLRMIDLTGKVVEVFANGITYRGRLVEINEAELCLEAESGWIVIPNDSVQSVREAIS